LLIDADVALVVDHVSVDVPPGAIVPGAAASDTAGGCGGAGFTVMVNVEVAVPPVPEAVNV
jgi:hypothetical protein